MRKSRWTCSNSQKFRSFFSPGPAPPRKSPCNDQSVQINPLLLGNPCRAVQLLSCLQDVCVEPLNELLLGVHIEPLLFEVVSQRVYIQLHHLGQQAGHAAHTGRETGDETDGFRQFRSHSVHAPLPGEMGPLLQLR